MPEGDTIVRVAAALRQRLLADPLLEVAPTTFERLAGRRVVDVETRGKHLFLHVEGGLALHSHLGMKGSWQLCHPGRPLPWSPRVVRALLRTPRTLAVCLRATRVEVVPSHALPVSHLGPDLLAPDVDLASVVARARQSARATVGEVLLDQRVAAGIGNLHRTDLLWEAGIAPWRPLAAVDDATLEALYCRARERMQRAAQETRLALPVGIHGRGGRPCPRCATLVRVRPMGDPPRLTYWCPRCQPG